MRVPRFAVLPELSERWKLAGDLIVANDYSMFYCEEKRLEITSEKWWLGP